MKILPFILVIALFGCSRPELPSTRLLRAVQEWVPEGTPLSSAQKIMEEHHMRPSTTLQGTCDSRVEITGAKLWRATGRHYYGGALPRRRYASRADSRFHEGRNEKLETLLQSAIAETPTATDAPKNFLLERESLIECR